MWLDLGKRAYVIHTYNFAYLEMHTNYKEWYTDLKLSRMIKEYCLHNPWRFHIYVSLMPSRFYELPNLKNWMYQLCLFLQICVTIMKYTWILFTCPIKNRCALCQRYNFQISWKIEEQKLEQIQAKWIKLAITTGL